MTDSNTVTSASSPRSQVRRSSWPSLDKAAWYGLAGEIVGAIAPTTEADDAALLGHFLPAFGNVIGRNAFYIADGKRQRGNLYVVVVGKTSKARKGTALAHINNVFEVAAPGWVEANIRTGLSSGEGLLWHLRDGDGSKADKRLLVIEQEFARVLAVMNRRDNTLSAQLRQGHDGDRMAVLTKNNPITATGAHLSMIAHITEDELRQLMPRVEAFNGFANRFMFFAVKRSKVLPFGGLMDNATLGELAADLAKAIEYGRGAGRLDFSRRACALWREVYAELSEGGSGLVGAVTARAEAHAVRLALLYALLDRCDRIKEDHLLAALAVWNYAEASAQYLFG